MVFCRFLDGCKTMPILRNVLKSDTNKGDIMGYNEEWSFSLEIYSKRSIATLICKVTILAL